MNQDVLKKVSLNRNTENKTLCPVINKSVVTRGWQEHNAQSPLGAMVQCLLIHCLQ